MITCRMDKKENDICDVCSEREIVKHFTLILIMKRRRRRRRRIIMRYLGLYSALIPKACSLALYIRLQIAIQVNGNK